MTLVHHSVGGLERIRSSEILGANESNTFVIKNFDLRCVIVGDRHNGKFWKSGAKGEQRRRAHQNGM